MQKFSEPTYVPILILFLFYIFDYCNCYEKVSITLISDCTNDQYECPLSTIKCNNEEIIRLRLKWPHAKDEAIVTLKSNKIVPHFSVNHISKRLRQEDITNEALYDTKGTFPKQFKSSQEIYGWIESNNSSSFVRGIVHFVGCGQVHFYGFIRESTRFYNIRPLLDNLSSNNKNIKTNNHHIHEIIDKIPDLDLESAFFTNHSKAIKNIYDFSHDFLLKKKQTPDRFKKEKDELEDKHCQIHIKVDESFHQHLNSDAQQITIHIRLAFILLNEIFQNANWSKDYHRYSFAFRSLDIDFSFGVKHSRFTNDTLKELLSEIDARSNYCLVYAFTGKKIFTNDSWIKPANGYAMPEGVFSRDNFAGSTVADCADPWKLKCFEIFNHEVLHTMGASHDALPNEDNTLKLMNEENDLISPAIAANLMLSKQTISSITGNTFDSHKYQLFLSAIDPMACGNSIVELGEQCDEGHGLHSANNTTQMCCNSKCEFIFGAKCSPHNSLCCTDKCQYTTKNSIHCMPWNFCAKEEFFCKFRLDFCFRDTVQVECNPDGTVVQVVKETIAPATTIPRTAPSVTPTTTTTTSKNKVQIVSPSEPIENTPSTTIEPSESAESDYETIFTLFFVTFLSFFCIFILFRLAMWLKGMEWLAGWLRNDNKPADEGTSGKPDGVLTTDGHNNPNINRSNEPNPQNDEEIELLTLNKDREGSSTNAKKFNRKSKK